MNLFLNIIEFFNSIFNTNITYSDLFGFSLAVAFLLIYRHRMKKKLKTILINNILKRTNYKIEELNLLSVRKLNLLLDDIDEKL